MTTTRTPSAETIMRHTARTPEPMDEFAALFARTSAGTLCQVADGVMLTVFPRGGRWWWAIDEGLGVPTYFASHGFETEGAALAALEEAW